MQKATASVIEGLMCHKEILQLTHTCDIEWTITSQTFFKRFVKEGGRLYFSLNNLLLSSSSFFKSSSNLFAHISLHCQLQAAFALHCQFNIKMKMDYGTIKHLTKLWGRYSVSNCPVHLWALLCPSDCFD